MMNKNTLLKSLCERAKYSLEPIISDFEICSSNPPKSIPKDILHQVYAVTCDIKALYQTILEALDTYNKLGVDNADATECGKKAALEYTEKVDRILDIHRKLLGYVLMDGDLYKYMLEKEGE